MKFLIAGLGSIGRRHLRNLIALGEVAPNRSNVRLLRTRRSTLPDEDLQGFAVETDLASALAWQPEAVVVANPTALHLDVAIPAARLGCALLLEKPVSHSMERVDELQRAVQQGGGRLLVGFQFRFHPGLHKIAELLAEGALGRVLTARAHWGEYLPGWHPWEDYRQGYSARADLGGGVVLTLSHPLDYLRWLLGEVTEVSAWTARRGDLQMDVEDTAEILLRFENDSLASVHLDYNQQPCTHTLGLIGAAGTIRWDQADGAVALYRAAEKRWERHEPPENFERNEMFLAEMRHFIQVARGDAQPVCTLQDGVRALQMALAALASGKQDGRMLSVSKFQPQDNEPIH